MSIPSVQALPSRSAKVDRTDSCTVKELHQAADAHARSIKVRFVERDVKCDRNWAVLAGDLEDPQATVGGPQGVGTTMFSIVKAAYGNTRTHHRSVEHTIP